MYQIQFQNLMAANYLQTIRNSASVNSALRSHAEDESSSLKRKDLDEEEDKNDVEVNEAENDLKQKNEEDDENDTSTITKKLKKHTSSANNLIQKLKQKPPTTNKTKPSMAHNHVY